MHRRIGPHFWVQRRKILQFLGIALLIGLLLLGFFRSYTTLHPLDIGLGSQIIMEPVGNLSARTGEPLQFTVRATAAPEDRLSYHVNPLPRGAQMDEATGTFTWRPAVNQSGAHRITLTATNGKAIAQEQISVVVEHRNTPPLLEPLGPVIVLAGERLNLQVNASDPDGDPLTYYLSGLPPEATFDNQTRVLEWPTEANQSGSRTIAITVSDGWSIAQERFEIIVFRPDTEGRPRPRPLRYLLGYLPEEELSPLLLDPSRPVHVVSPGPGPVLQERIAMASPGDIIMVNPGTYYGSINVDRSLTLLGLDDPVIDAGGSGSVISLTIGGSTVAGFTLVNSGNQTYDSGIKVSSSRNRILNNRISGNPVGIYLIPPSNSNTIRNNTIANSTLDGIRGDNLFDRTLIDSNVILNSRGHGVHIERSWNVTLKNNTIAFNDRNGITLNYTHESHLEGNYAESNGLDGMYITNGARDTIKGNTFSLNGGNGLMIEQSLDPVLRGDQIEAFSDSEYLNRVSRNTCTGNGRAGIALHEVTAILGGNTCLFNGYGLRFIEAATLTAENGLNRNGVGIFLVNTNNNMLRGNEATENDVGIYVEGRSLENVISANNASLNREYGIILGSHTERNVLRDNLMSLNTMGCTADTGKNLVASNECTLPKKENPWG